MEDRRSRGRHDLRSGDGRAELRRGDRGRPRGMVACRRGLPARCAIAAGVGRGHRDLPVPRASDRDRGGARPHHLLPEHRQAHAGRAARPRGAPSRRQNGEQRMTERLFAEGWTVEDLDLGVTARVRLPHDAMIGRRRSADAPTGYHGAYFPGGRYRYVKRWEVPDGEDRRHRLRFEGIGGAATISLNGIELAAVSSRYRDVLIDADSAVHAGEPNELVVEVDDSAKPDSRWYTGSGLYRPVWLDETGPVRFANDGVRIVTEEAASDAATLRVTTFTDGEAGNAAVRVSVRDGSRTVAEASGAPGELALTIAEPRLWSADSPHTYVVEVALLTGGQVSDSRTVRTGIRTVSVDARRGLRVNGREVLLRGACIHHDSGVLGAATHRAFEYRRARILKQNGYNAVRSSHNPLSRDMLDASDEVGLYVMDELTDTWFNPKTAHDASSRFEDTWPDDLAAMIATDRNHPSVIIYSIGNEIAETATPAGVNAARRLADAARRLDPTRPTTLAVNFLLNVLASRGKSVFSTQEEETDENKSEKKPNAVTSTVANVIADKLGSISQLVSRLPARTRPRAMPSRPSTSRDTTTPGRGTAATRVGTPTGWGAERRRGPATSCASGRSWRNCPTSSATSCGRAGTTSEIGRASGRGRWE